MAKEAQTTSGRRWNRWRIFGWSLGALLLLLPLIAVQFTGEMNWDAFDFVFLGVLLGGVGLGLELAVRKGSLAYRMAAGLALGAAFLTILANGAVGMIGSENNAYNLVFGGVLLVALLGAMLARFEAAGMARAMALTAITQAVAGAAGVSSDAAGAVLSIAFAAPWLLSAALFRGAAREQANARGPIS